MRASNIMPGISHQRPPPICCLFGIRRFFNATCVTDRGKHFRRAALLMYVFPYRRALYVADAGPDAITEAVGTLVCPWHRAAHGRRVDRYFARQSTPTSLLLERARWMRTWRKRLAHEQPTPGDGGDNAQRVVDSVRPWTKRTSNTVTSPGLSAPGYTHSVQPWLGSQRFACLDLILPANRPTSGRPRRVAWKRSFRFFGGSCFDGSACTRGRRVRGRGSRSFLCNET